MPSNFCFSSSCFLTFSCASAPCFAMMSLKFMSALASSPLVTFSCPIGTGGCFSFGAGKVVIVTVYTPGRRLRMANFPSASVFASSFAPWSLTASTFSPNHGFPLTSKIVPAMDPFCAAACGERTVTNAPASSTASHMDFPSLFMLFLLLPRRTLPGLAGGMALLSSILAQFQVLRVRADRHPVSYGIPHSGLPKRREPQQATVAHSASPVFVLITRPRQMQRRAKLDSSPDNLAFLQRNHRRPDFDLRLRPRSHAHQLLKNLVILRAAIGIPGTILRHGPNVNRLRANGFRPAHRHGKKMRIAKRHIGHRNRTPLRPGRAQFIFRHRDFRIRKRRPANGPKMIELHNQPPARAHSIEVRNLLKRPSFPFLGPLPITGMQQGHVPRAM